MICQLDMETMKTTQQKIDALLSKAILNHEFLDRQFAERVSFILNRGMKISVHEEKTLDAICKRNNIKTDSDGSN